MNLQFGGEIDTRLKHYSAEQVSHGTMMRLRELLVAMGEQQPLLLILEDLHWSDDLSLDLVSLLMDELMEHPLMLVCVHRPERKHRVWQLSNQAQRKCLERYTEVPLQKLRDAESRRLVQELLAIEDLPDSVRDMILRKSEGNPFFIEEVIRSLIERGLVYHEDDRWKAKEDILELEVPDTIQSVILARVDRLEAEAKYVLQCASVIGRLFKHRLLEHLTQKQRELDRYISEFEDRDLVYEERTIPELEYAFKHALTQEATYQGILEQRRRVFHRIVAQGIERLYQERIEDFYEELAYHWERSGDDEKTLEYLMKAGEKAAGNYLNEAAINYYTRALDLAKDMGISGDRLGEIYEARAKLYRNMGFYEDAISDMEEAALSYADGPIRACAYQLIASIYAWSMSDSAGAVEYARRALREIDPADKSREATMVYAGSANILSRFVDLGEGEPLLHKAVNFSEEM
jgi:predicted ATPase